MQLADLDLNKLYTYADYLKWQFEDRVELILGKIFKKGAPSPRHQNLSMNISGELYQFLKSNPCGLYTAPFDVRFPPKTKDGNQDDYTIPTVLQPDICIVCDPSKIDNKGCVGAPDIVVEILSPGNNRKELQNKYDIYEQNGVKEYWIVSSQDETLVVNTLRDGKYQASRIGDFVTSTILPGLSLDLTAVFKTFPENKQ